MLTLYYYACIYVMHIIIMCAFGEVFVAQWQFLNGTTVGSRLFV